MFETPAHIISEVMTCFGNLPPEVLSAKHVTQSFVRKLEELQLTAQQSPEGRESTILTLENLTADRDERLPADVAIPLHLERKIGAAPYTAWMFVPWVALSVLEESRLRGDTRCTFYRDSDNQRWHLMVSYDPTSIIHRLWYWSDPTAIADLSDPLRFRRHFAVMIFHAMIVDIIPPMLMRAANLPEDQQLTSSQLNAINALLAHSKNELEKPGGWNDKFEMEIRSDKSTRGRMRRPILSRGFRYPRTY